MPSRQWLYFAGFIISGLGVVGAGLLALLESLAVLFGPPTEAFILSAMLGAAAEWIVLAVVCVILTVTFFIATVVSVLRSLSFPRNEKVASLFSRLERTLPALDQFSVSDRFEPTAEDRKQQLKEQYVGGEISEIEFERQMDQLIEETVPEERSRATPRTAFELDDESR